MWAWPPGMSRGGGEVCQAGSRRSSSIPIQRPSKTPQPLKVLLPEVPLSDTQARVRTSRRPRGEGPARQRITEDGQGRVPQPGWFRVSGSSMKLPRQAWGKAPPIPLPAPQPERTPLCPFPAADPVAPPGGQGRDVRPDRGSEAGAEASPDPAHPGAGLMPPLPHGDLGAEEPGSDPVLPPSQKPPSLLAEPDIPSNTTTCSWFADDVLFASCFNGDKCRSHCPTHVRALRSPPRPVAAAGGRGWCPVVGAPAAPCSGTQPGAEAECPPFL